MGFMNIFKSKKRESLDKKELDIPPAPPTSDELPEFPSPSEIGKMPKKIPKAPAPPNMKKIEAEAVREQEEVLEEREELSLTRPIFVPLENFRDVMDEVTLVKNILKENEDTLVRVSEFKEDEDKEFNKWENQIRDIQKKLIYADKTLFK